MHISAISSNQTNFKGSDIGEIAKSVKDLASKKFDQMEADDFNGIAEKIGGDRHTAPFNYFLATAALSVAAFLAARRTSLATIKGMEGKFPLYSSVDKAGAYLNGVLTKAKKAVSPAKVKNVRTFFQNTANSAVNWMDDFAKKGITEADKAVHKGPIAQLYAKNAVRKLAANTVGTGAAVATISTRNSDENNNGIPDGAEKKKKSAFKVMKDVAGVIPTVAAAVNLA